MADIQLRFGKDMLVISAPIDATLKKQNINYDADRQFLNLMEAETVIEALKLQKEAGAQCLVTPTQDITPARLAHVSMGTDGTILARNAINITKEAAPQHILVGIGPCGLPLDPSSKNSLNENKQQYKDAAQFFEGLEFDAFFLDEFVSIDDLRCALMGVRQVSDKPIIASVVITDDVEAAAAKAAQAETAPANDFDITSINSGLPSDGYQVVEDTVGSRAFKDRLVPLDVAKWPEAIDVMIDLGASVIGFETPDTLNKAYEYAQQVAEITTLPILASLQAQNDPLNATQLGLTPLEELNIYTPDTLYRAALHLRQAGAQFLRATGDALPTYTGALAAAVSGMDALPRKH